MAGNHDMGRIEICETTQDHRGLTLACIREKHHAGDHFLALRMVNPERPYAPVKLSEFSMVQGNYDEDLTPRIVEAIDELDRRLQQIEHRARPEQCSDSSHPRPCYCEAT